MYRAGTHGGVGPGIVTETPVPHFPTRDERGIGKRHHERCRPGEGKPGKGCGWLAGASHMDIPRLYRSAAAGNVGDSERNRVGAGIDVRVTRVSQGYVRGVKPVVITERPVPHEGFKSIGGVVELDGKRCRSGGDI